MKNKKRFIIGLMTTLSMLSLVTVEASAESVGSKIEPEDMFEIQENACKAHERLYNEFSVEGSYIYPDDFGGDYIDYDTLHIQVTSKDSIEWYENILSEFDDVISYDVVDNSYNYLFNEAEKFVHSDEIEKGYVSYGVDTMKNMGFVSVTSDYYNKASAFGDAP